MKASRRIRVLHVGKFYAPVEGGIENVVEQLVQGFRGDAEITADVLVAQQNGPEVIEQMHGVRVHRVQSYGVLLGMPLAPRLVTAIERASREYDLLHVHVPNPLPFFCNWEEIRRHGARLLIHHHSDIVRPAQRRALRLVGREERRFYDAADAVVATSDGLLRHSETLRHHRAKSSILPLSIDLQALGSSALDSRAETRAHLGFEESDVVFFFLGRLVYYKGIEDLLHAAARTHVKVLIGGDGPLREKLWRLTVRLGLAGQVQFLGKIPQARLPEIFAASDVFVLPSNAASEAFGVVQLEAMAHGLPVINTSLPTGVPEVSLDGLTGLTVTPGDVEELARAMRLLSSDQSMRLQFGLAARRRVQEFSRPSVIEKLRELYREVMNLPIERAVVPWLKAVRSSPGISPMAAGFEGEIRTCPPRSSAITRMPSSR